MKLIQVTDCHMRAAPNTIHWGYRPQASLAAVLDAAAAAHPDAEMVLVTGDCVHVYPLDEGFEPEGEEAYQLLRSLVEARFPAATVRALPGNHDSRAALSAVFPESVGGSAATVPPTGLHCFAELMGCWLVLGCDSQSGDPHDPAGEGDISFAQLSWLRSVLTAHPETPTIICLHHPPIKGTKSFTERGADAVESLVTGFAQVKAVVAGHIHNDFENTLGGVPLLATPSCVFQFHVDAQGQVGKYDVDHGPGYRVLELGDSGTISSRVVRPEMREGLSQLSDLLSGPRLERRSMPSL